MEQIEAKIGELIDRFPAIDRDWLDATIQGAKVAGDSPLHDDRQREADARDELDKIAEAARKLRERLQAILIEGDSSRPRTATAVTIAMMRAGGSFQDKIAMLRELENQAVAGANLLDKSGRPPARRSILVQIIADYLTRIGEPVNANASGPLVQTLLAICAAIGDDLDDSNALTYARRVLSKDKPRTQ